MSAGSTALVELLAGLTAAPDPQVDSYDVRVGESLGEIVLVKIEKKKYWLQDDWFCRYISVKTPCGKYVEFPCFRWLVGDNEVVLRDGRGGPNAAVSGSLTSSVKTRLLTF